MKTLTLTMLLIVSSLLLVAQCPDCTPDLSCTTEDAFPTICPAVLPDATSGEAYQSTITFFLPPQVVDPDSGIEATLQEVEVTGIIGLPFGMDISLSSDNNTYYPSQGDEYGCASLCGTPLLAGQYDVLINVSVIAVAFGFEQTLDQSFSLPLTVLQGEGGNASFTLDQFAACGTLSVNPEALITEGGLVSYAWDFGNGNTSNVPFPATVNYNEPGDYTISLNTVVQNYVLTGASILQIGSGWGGDLDDGFGLLNPDPYFVIRDFNGVTVFTSSVVNNVQSASWSDLNVLLQEGTYTIQFWDSDGTLTDDDDLGTTDFQVSAGTAVVNVGGTSGTLNIELQTSAEFSDQEVVSVFPNPNPVLVGGSINEYLVASGENLNTFTWYLNGDTLQNEFNDSLFLELPGVYSLNVSNVFGCTSWADSVVVCPEVNLEYDELTQSIDAGGAYDTYAWFYNGLLLTGENESTLLNANPGNYSVEITTSYGCVVNSPVLTVTSGEGTSEMDFERLLVYPQPAMNDLHFELPLAGQWDIQIVDHLGRKVTKWSTQNQKQTLDVNQWASGLYVLTAVHRSGRLAKAQLIVK